MSSRDKVYEINMRSGDIAVQLRKAFDDIFARRTFEKVRVLVNDAVDKEIGKVFQRIAIHIFQNNFQELQPYLPTPWRQYSTKYLVRKIKHVGHLDWFKYGYRTARNLGQEELGDYLRAIEPESILEHVGNTVTSLSRNNKRITVSVAPHARFSRSNMERQFSDLIDEEQMNKLQNRRRAYRALIGPEFQFMLNDRIPQVVSKVLARS